MLPQLEEDELIGPVADNIATGMGDGAEAQQPAGVDMLAGAPEVDLLASASEVAETPLDMKGMINILTRRDKRVTIAGTAVTVEQDDVGQALKTAIISGIKEKKRDERDANKLEAPITAVKEAGREAAKAIDAFKTVADDPDFDQKQRKSLEAGFKKLKRTYRELEAALEKAHVIGK